MILRPRYGVCNTEYTRWVKHSKMVIEMIDEERNEPASYGVGKK